METFMSEKVDTWERISSKEIADCRVFKVREDLCERESDSKRSTFFVIESPDWVNIIAMTKDEEVVLIEQFRHGTEEIILEIPGGMIDENEDAETAARRELLEETGFSSDQFILLGKSSPNPAIQGNTLYHFLALNAEKTHETTFDEHESLVTKLVSLKEIKKLILKGKITHSLVLAAFAIFSLRRYEDKNL
jgi:8-oxo-dGTP pyrophosphatase MutT (NUDIX family)